MYEDASRKLEAINGKVRYTHKIRSVELEFDPEYCGLLDNVSTNPYLKDVASGLKAQGESPSDWFCVQGKNDCGEVKLIVLPKAARRIIEETASAKSQAREAAITPAQRERWEIEVLFQKAERLVDYPGSYHPALNAAEAALTAWREKYPEAAREEDRRNLLAQADKHDELAVGALVYDADGWLSASEQETRAAEFRAKAEKLRARAAALEAQ